MGVNTENFILGSAKVFVGNDKLNLVEVGSAKGISFDYTLETVELKSGNYGVLSERVKTRKADIKFNLEEIKNLELLNNMQGIDQYSTVAAAEVVGKTQIITDGEANTLYRIENQNHDGSPVTVTSITGLIENDDYEIVKDSEGIYGIIFLSDFAGEKTVTYNYTPASAKVFKTGKSITVATKCIRLVNTDENGKDFMITAEYAKKTNGFSFTFPDADSDDQMSSEIQFTATRDPNNVDLPVFEIYDEQSV